MKIKLAKIESRHQSLCMIGNKKLPIKISYAVGKNILKLQEELEAIEKTRIKLLEQHAEKEEDGSCKIVDGHYELGDNEQKLNEEFMEFMNSEVEVAVYTVPEAILETMEDVRYDALTPAELIALDFMLEHPQETVVEEIEPKA